MKVPQLVRSDGISVVCSHLPFRWPKKSSWTRTPGSMYCISMPEVVPAAAVWAVSAALANAAISDKVRVLRR